MAQDYTHLFENEDFSEYIQDLFDPSSTKSAPPPDAMAPADLDQFDGKVYNDYDAATDPEEQTTAELKESLREAGKTVASIIRDFANESPEDWSYTAFQLSPDYNPSIDLKKYKAYITDFLKKGQITAGPDTKMPDEGLKRGSAYSGSSKAAENTAYGDPPSPKDPTEWSRESQEWSGAFGSTSERSDDGTADALFRSMYNIVRNICLGRAQKRHALIFGDPGIGKTYEVRKAAEASLPPARLVYESSDMGSAPSALLAFFYHNKDNKVIILDDNDSMLSEGAQRVANILKALLDPMAPHKPISVPTSMTRTINSQLEQFTESTIITIDREKLREGILKIDSNGREACYEHISRDDATDLLNILREDEELDSYHNKFAGRYDKWRHLHEATSHIFDEDEVVGDEDEDEDDSPRRPKTEREEMDSMRSSVDAGDDEGGIPRQFTFNSSVIFISNLSKDRLNSAILDRVRSIGISLNLPEFTDRLTKVMHGLCTNTEFNSTPQELLEWAKKCCYTGLKGVIACWEDGAPLFNGPIIINRKLTFRAFEEFVDTFMEEAYDYEERHGGGQLTQKAYRDKISKDCLKNTVRKSMLPWLREKNKQ